MKNERLTWYKNELRRLTEDLNDDCDTILYIKSKIMKLLVLITTEIDYGSTEVSLHRHEFIDMKMDIKDVVDTIVEKECLRKSSDERTLRIRYNKALYYVRKCNRQKGEGEHKYSYELPIM